MLVARLAFPLAVLFLASTPSSLIASEATWYRPSRVPRSSAWLRREDRYFEQCRSVDAWKEHLGYVSVLAFLDPAWQYSFRQAVMLELLSARLRKSGFPDIRFFAISPVPDSTESERSEDDLETEAWREIGAKHEMESFVGDDFLRGDGAEITFLRDDPWSRMWERFRASRDQVIIIDRCGKLTYHVIVPWSILFFPYVKAAILSTYKEDPCGGCDPTVYRAPSHEEHVVKLTNVTDEEEANPTQNETANVDAIWTTESPENATLRNVSSSEEQRETSTASSIPLEEMTSDTDRPNVSIESSTNSMSYRYNNDATESRFDEDRPDAEGTGDEEDPTNSEGGGIVAGGTAATFEPQRDVLLPEQTGAHPSANKSFTPANHGDRTLLLDEPVTDETESDSTPADEETTTSNLADEVRDRNATPENTERLGEDALLPLRIIMYAPHVHKTSRKMKKHTHLILKTGDPGFHGHLDSGVDVAPPIDLWRILTDICRVSGTDARVASSEEYDWGTTEADTDEKNDNQKYMFDGDESPGLYGEVADYWKSYEDNDITDRNETSNNSTTNYNEKHRTNVSDHTTSFSESEESYSVANDTEGPNVESSTYPQNIESSRPINMNNQVDREEEVQYKLTEHYKKLLPWIDYRLSK